MITRGYKQTLKTRRRLSFLSLLHLYIPLHTLTCLSESSLGDSPFPIELLCRISGEFGHSDIDMRSVDQSDSFYRHELAREILIEVGAVNRAEADLSPLPPPPTLTPAKSHRCCHFPALLEWLKAGPTRQKQ